MGRFGVGMVEVDYHQSIFHNVILAVIERLFILQVLLQSDKVPANFSDRSLLKNLGHWLGLMTLAQNKPVLMRVRPSFAFFMFSFSK